MSTFGERLALAQERFKRWSGVCLMAGVRPMTFLHPHLPARMRERLPLGWTWPMFREAITSLGRRFYVDIPHDMEIPAQPAPACEVEPAYRLSAEELASFYRDGFLGPIDVFTPAEMVTLREELVEVMERRESEVYPLAPGKTEFVRGPIPESAVRSAIQTRDRYIDCEPVWRIIAHKAITERLAQLLGPDLLVWRSQFYNKGPGAEALGWHSESCFLFDGAGRVPALEPRAPAELFQITVWMAVDDADRENGCMHFLPGSHRSMQPLTLVKPPTLRPGEEVAWWHVTRSLTADVPWGDQFPIPQRYYDEGLVAAMPLRAGQCVLFTERATHASPPNLSQRRRLGVNFRVVRGDVAVNRQLDFADFRSIQARFSLERWGTIPLRGPSATTNRVVPPPTQ
ncbi:MAG: phytanoyl-CoA dioxygenase family protein [Nannocystaceae bacterium]|nr:phytanoyl-CoA dioxygenase family protein [Myxococcales bacterium]